MREDDDDKVLDFPAQFCAMWRNNGEITARLNARVAANT
ncbi:hypothetical protein Z949_737 [Sulfitobacter guttiformis KCTC 32187]|nr:hypothetical protein Z949_737 [Sulfitobacter guttiformis KCTC 32187]